MTDSYFGGDERTAIECFLLDGYLVFKIEDRQALDSVRGTLVEWARVELGKEELPPPDRFLNQVNECVGPDRLNAFRLKLIANAARDRDFHARIYRLANRQIHWLVGNELAMQRSPNLSIQLPGDASSLLPLHTDVWSGNSPYEVVFWLPLVDCYRTKSMYILPRPKSEAVFRDFGEYSGLTAEGLYQAIRQDLVWLDVPYGHGLIFSHSLLHGNRVNEEKETRWTMNIRFKSLLTPYRHKELGESFMPITVRPATRIGIQHIDPEC